MRTFDFNLSKFEGIEGKLTLAVPKYRQRLQMIKECNFKLDGEGNVKMGSETFDSMLKMLEISEPFFKEVDLKAGQDIHVKSFEEMEDYGEFDQVLSEAAMAIMNAGRLGERKDPN